MSDKQKADHKKPKCPWCNTSPVRYSIEVGITPNKEYALPQVWCTDCGGLLPVMPMPTSVQAQQTDENETGLGQQASGIVLPS